MPTRCEMAATNPMPGSSAASFHNSSVVLQRALEVLRLVSPSLIIDAGCGAGRESVQLARETGALVIALDNDPVALRAADAAPGVLYVRADAARLPLVSSAADAVYSFGLLQVLTGHGRENIRSVLRDLRRALHPNGVAILSSSANFRTSDDTIRSLTGAEVSQVMRGTFRLHELIGLGDTDARGTRSRYWYIHAMPVPAGGSLR